MSVKSLQQLFSEALNLPLEQIQDSLTYNTIGEWDSISHMSLVAAIENEYGIMLDTHDIIDMSSFAQAKEILKKYEVAA